MFNFFTLLKPKMHLNLRLSKNRLSSVKNCRNNLNTQNIFIANLYFNILKTG